MILDIGWIHRFIYYIHQKIQIYNFDACFKPLRPLTSLWRKLNCAEVPKGKDCESWKIFYDNSSFLQSVKSKISTSFVFGRNTFDTRAQRQLTHIINPQW